MPYPTPAGSWLRADWNAMVLPSGLTTGFDALKPAYSPQWVIRTKSVLFRGCRYEGIRGLDGFRGASVDAGDLLDLGVAMASALGIKVSVEDRA